MSGRGAREPQRGFTLVEIMIVVVIIGLLAAMALPAMNYVRETSQNAAAANDLRVFCDAFYTYALEHGTYPADTQPDELPAEMADRLPVNRWHAVTPIGGHYDWDLDVAGVHASVSVNSPTASTSQMEALDRRIDDGNLNTGHVVFSNGALRLIIE